MSNYLPVYPFGYKTTNPPSANGGSYQGSLPASRFLRFYIPPSANGQTSLALFCPQKASIGAVARLGAPPKCNLEAYKTSSVGDDYYLGLPWDGLGTLQNLRDRDWRVRNGSGTIGILRDDHGSSKGEWLYVQILYDGNNAPNVQGCSFVCSVDAAAFKTWYDSVKWDSTGNPIENIYSIPTGSCDFSSAAPPGPPPPPPSVKHTITVIKDGIGYVNPNGAMVANGSSQQFKFVDNLLFQKPKKAQWKTEVSSGVATEYTFNNVMKDETLRVDFNLELPPPEPESYLAAPNMPEYEIAFDKLKKLLVKFSTLGERILYAGYAQDENIYLMHDKLDIFGNIAWEKYCEGSELVSYETAIDTVYVHEFLVFEEVLPGMIAGCKFIIGAITDGLYEGCIFTVK